MFILPFALMWYFVIKNIIDDQSDILQSSMVAMLLGTGHQFDLVTYLYTKPAELSSFLILAIYFTPMFALLAGNDLYASDIGRGYFRLLITRCQRLEIFIARFLSVLILVSISIGIVGLVTVVTLMINSSYETMEMLSYLFWILMILIFYMAPFIAYMAIISSLFNSAISTILVGMVSYTVLIIAIPITNAYLSEGGIFSYLLPSGLKADLMAIDTYDLYTALAVMPVYTFIFLYIAWLRFRNRNF
jgi:Cu-processing system permease protein